MRRRVSLKSRSHPKVASKLASKGQIGAQGNLNTDIVKRTILPLPPLEEQKKIANILTSTDYEIESESSRRERLELLKKGLMEVLLTGKLRVAV